MRYNESVAQSAECLRLALQFMARHDAGLHPVTYAVWYEYAAGINSGLAAEIDALTAKGERLNDEAIYALYRKHVADLDEASVQRFSTSVQRIVAYVSESAATAGDRASRFGDALERWNAVLTRPSDSIAMSAQMDGVLQDTREMQQAISLLQARLEHSTREAEQLKQEVARARAEARVDGLTGLANRKCFDQELDACIASMTPGSIGPCLLMLDIDHFKRINDSYGHIFGDKVLRSIGGVLKANVKGRDTAARYGGEEFAVLLPLTPLDGAVGLAEQLRRTIAGGRVRRMDSAETIGNITVSIGLASFCIGESAARFVGRADRALYVSKEQGRNRVTVAENALACQP